MSSRARSAEDPRESAGDGQLGFFFEKAKPPAAETVLKKAPLRPEKQRPSTLPAWAAAAFPDSADEEQPPERRVWRVSELVGDVRAHVERAYTELWVRGEVSNLRAAPSGHTYFTLKDGDAQLPAVLFRREAQALRFSLADGLEVLLRGRVSVYEQRGQMQLIAEYLEPVGAGSLQLAFEQLKQKLNAEGLFALDRKRPLPAFPHCVGIVTSPTGAVIRDFLNIAARRHAALDVLLYPAAVQGDTAAAEIAAGIAWFSGARNVDVIVVARGGGSLEDLAAFNSETVARAIAASALPVVSAVGHETDFTIADFVADLRAPTPSAAAELITAAQHRIGEHVDALAERLGRAARYRLALARQTASRIAMDAAGARMRNALGRRAQRVDEQRFRLERGLTACLRVKRERLQAVQAALARHHAPSRLGAMRERWSALDARLARSGAARLVAARQQLAAGERALASLSPAGVLQRGYALVFRADGTLLRNAAQAIPGEAVRARLGRGSVHATVTGTDTEDA